jgi:hypothetical protein
MRFDVVADFIAYTPDDVERDFRLFGGKTAQYIFISSASAYQKPLASPFVHGEHAAIQPVLASIPATRSPASSF